MNHMKRQNYMTPEDEPPRSEGVQYSTDEEWRAITNSSIKNETARPKQKWCSVVDERKSTLSSHWKGWCWSSNILVTSCEELTQWKKTLELWEILKAKGGGKGQESITNSMDINLSKLREIGKDRVVWHVAVHEVAKNQIQLSTEQQVIEYLPYSIQTKFISWIISITPVIFSIATMFIFVWLTWLVLNLRKIKIIL